MHKIKAIASIVSSCTLCLGYRKSEQTQNQGFERKCHAPQVQQEHAFLLGNTRNGQPAVKTYNTAEKAAD